ncbi:MAG: peptidase [Acidobacteria bacterium]|nr:peptidase [Acidobacteriota bacterium]
MDLLPKPEAARRVAQLQQWIGRGSLDAVFVFQNVDLFYFAGTMQSGLLCIPDSGEPLYFVQKSLTRARMESPWKHLLPFPGFRKLPEWIEGEGVRSLRTVGIESDVLPTAYYLRLKDRFPEVQFVDASEAIRTIRMLKSRYESDQIRQAGRMLRSAFERIPQWARPGATELQVMAQLECFLRGMGHPGIVRMRGFNNQIGFGTISSGASASHPTPFPGPVGSVGLTPAAPGGGSEHMLASGETMMADIVGCVGGYIADVTRTFSLGSAPPDMMKAHGFVLELKGEIEAMLKPGTLSSHMYRHALERIKESPYAQGFMGDGDGQVQFLGHGVGLELDELPVLAGGFDIPLQPGMTIAIEPKIIFAGRGGVGTENTYLVTESGFENLTDFPEEIVRIEA